MIINYSTVYIKYNMYTSIFFFFFLKVFFNFIFFFIFFIIFIKKNNQFIFFILSKNSLEFRFKSSIEDTKQISLTDLLTTDNLLTPLGKI